MIRRGGYTLVEVLMALVILAILAVPLGYTIHAGLEGSRRAHREDRALALVREEWSRVRALEADSIRDTLLDPEGNWRLVREVFDSADRAALGLEPGGNPARTGLPVEVSVCAMERAGDAWDTVRCFRWMRPRIGEAP
ncbi:MAG TPA: type II secretion system protein [Fibrobacteria bacterium]|nr:type II secretion system protein [Fibrobacteria bacterium]HOX50626.1 type II secretion system protein [Fibrobacteria bacterium]